MKIAVTALLGAALFGALPAYALNGAAYPELIRFVDEMATRHGMSRELLLEQFRQVRFRDDVLRAMDRPAERLPWHRYRRLFIDSATVAAGRAYWAAHRGALARARAEYGVSPALIVAIIGIESRYGRHQGAFPVLDSLTTLTLGYPRRARFFRGELEQFLLLAREEGLDPLAQKGSYAGALGVPQFIPSSYRRYAVDFDGDRRRDLFASDSDVIGSVANYFFQHDWRAGQPVVFSARVKDTPPAGLISGNGRPQTDFGTLRRAGILAAQPIGDRQQVALLRLEGARGPQYKIALWNFFVITRYNHSVNYAMAVYELSQRILAGGP